MSLNRSGQHLSQRLSEFDCLLYLQLFLNLFALEIVILTDWALPGLEFFLIILIVNQYVQNLNRNSLHYVFLTYRDLEGWFLTNRSGQEVQFHLESMHWNALRWIILNLVDARNKNEKLTLVFCPSNISGQNYRQLKKLYLGTQQPEKSI